MTRPVETRPATSSRPMRRASPRSSSPRAGWHRILAALRRVDGDDLGGLIALILMISPFIF